eukprot:m.9821 g.9821  ORF g.9821 m.9821 type:complete len:56 (+) comp9504_c0_seq7:1330-1497(+)
MVAISLALQVRCQLSSVQAPLSLGAVVWQQRCWPLADMLELVGLVLPACSTIPLI